MDKQDERQEALIELGVASEETKGDIAGTGESVGRFKLMGLSDD